MLDHSGLNDSTDVITTTPSGMRHPPTTTDNNDRPSWMTPPTQQQQYRDHTATDNYFNRPSVGVASSNHQHHTLPSSVSGFGAGGGGGPIDASAVSPVPSSVESFLSLHDRTINRNQINNGGGKNNSNDNNSSRREEIIMSSRANSFTTNNSQRRRGGGGDRAGVVEKTNSIGSQFSVSGSWLRRAGSLDGPQYTKGGNSKAGVVGGRGYGDEDWVRGPDEDIYLGPGDGAQPINRFLSSPSLSGADPFLHQHQQDRRRGWAASINNSNHHHTYSEEDDDDEEDTLTGGGLLYSTIIRPIEVKLLKYILSAPTPTSTTHLQEHMAPSASNTQENKDVVDPAEIDNRYWADNLKSRLKQDATDVRPLGEDGGGAHHHDHLPKEEALGSLFDSMVDYFTKRRFEKSSPTSLSATKKYRKVKSRGGGSKSKTIAQRSPLLAVLGEGYVPDLGPNLAKLGVSLIACHLMVAYTLLWVF